MEPRDPSRVVVVCRQISIPKLKIRKGHGVASLCPPPFFYTGGRAGKMESCMEAK